MNKEFFQRTWGPDGYYEKFSYGVGIDKVCEVALYPFFNKSKIALEIGSGGGVFTEIVLDFFGWVYAIDVIQMPSKFQFFKNFYYIELPDNTYNCYAVKDNSIDFCFSYNLFCHLSNEHIGEYIADVYRVLTPGSDFVFMLANYAHTKKHLDREYELGELTPVGHYVQDERTIDLIIDKEKWEVVSPNMIPEHRDIIVHLKKK